MLFLCAPPLCFAAGACTVQDDAGNTLHLAEPAQRIISLSPDLTESLITIGAGSALVGVIAGSDFPPQAKSLRRVGDYHALDRELILALKPDLIVAWGESHVQDVHFFKKAGIPVYLSHPRQLLDIPRTMQNLGCLSGHPKQAGVLAQAFRQRYAQLKKQYSRPGKTKVRVFYEISDHPLITINRRSWISEAIELCGGENIFAPVGFSGLFKQTAITVSLESVLQAKPDVILAGLPEGWQKRWKNGKLISINPALIERPGPRILEGVQEMCAKIVNHPSPYEVG